MADIGMNSSDTGRRKKLAGYGLAAVLAVGLVAVIGMQMTADGSTGSTPTGQVSAIDTGDRFYQGADDAPVTVVEFGDFKCPHCGNFESNVYPQLKEDYIDDGTVKFYYYHLPVTGQQAQAAAVAAECVAEQDADAFWDYKSALFERQQEPWQGLTFFTDLADQVAGDAVDASELRTCLENGDTVETVQDHVAKAQEQGIRTTPTIIVNEDIVQGNDYASLKDAIEDNR